MDLNAYKQRNVWLYSHSRNKSSTCELPVEWLPDSVLLTLFFVLSFFLLSFSLNPKNSNLFIVHLMLNFVIKFTLVLLISKYIFLYTLLSNRITFIFCRFFLVLCDICSCRFDFLQRNHIQCIAHKSHDWFRFLAIPFRCFGVSRDFHLCMQLSIFYVQFSTCINTNWKHFSDYC